MESMTHEEFMQFLGFTRDSGHKFYVAVSLCSQCKSNSWRPNGICPECKHPISKISLRSFLQYVRVDAEIIDGKYEIKRFIKFYEDRSYKKVWTI